MEKDKPKISVCIPHWQVKYYIVLCMRSIRKHSRNYDLEMIIVDNGSRDESLEYLRSLPWIRLIERPEESPVNWPMNVFSAWDAGIKEATGDYFITMHSDVFVKRDDWIDPFLREMGQDPSVAGVGAWKLYLENPVYALQKRITNYVLGKLKNAFGRKKKVRFKQRYFPRDYCAMYRRDVILQHNLTFTSLFGRGGGGSIAKQLWDAGYKTRMIPVRELASKIVHIAHGTAAVSKKKLNSRYEQKKVERRKVGLFEEEWVKELASDESIDGI